MKLNAKQSVAAQIIDGPVMVVAGAGTGKTQLLSQRIRIMLESDLHINPEMILAVTYTDAGCTAIRKRLVQFMGAEAYKVNIYTFHSLCHEIVKWNLDRFGIRNIEPVSDLENQEIIKEIISELPQGHLLKRITGDIYYDIPRLNNLFVIMKHESWNLDFIRSACESFIDSLPDDPRFQYQRANKSKGINVGDPKQAQIDKIKEDCAKLIAAAELLDVYNCKLTEKERYSFADMIHWVIKAFKEDKDMLMTYQERYQYVLIDEFQDTNGSQMELVEQLLNFFESPNVFVVGDGKQCVYEFAGARMQNTVDFVTKYNPKIVYLDENYRSTQSILNHSFNLIENNTIKLSNFIDGIDEPPLKAALKEDNTKIAAIQCVNITQEQIYVVESIRRLIKSGELQSDIAVIYRRHAQSQEIIKLLKAEGFSINVKRKADVLETTAVKKIITVLNYVDRNREQLPSDQLLYEILHYDYFDIPALKLQRLMLQKDRYQPLSEYIMNNEVVTEISSAFIKLQELVKYSYNHPVINLVEKIIHDTYLLGDDIYETMAVNTFLEFVKGEMVKNPETDNKRIMMLVADMRKRKLTLPIQDLRFNPDGINFVTAHGAKGLEYKHVFIIGATVNEWETKRTGRGNFYLPETLVASQSDNEHEANRRLFYVAMTRAMDSLTITFSDETNDGKSLQASSFIHESGIEILPQPEAYDPFEYILNNTAVINPEKISGNIIEERLERYRLSPTHMNEYLKCGLSFYYNRILGVPSMNSIHLIQGNAIHLANKRFYDNNLSKHEYFNVAVDYIHRERYLLTEVEKLNAINYCMESMENLYSNYLAVTPTRSMCEYKISNVSLNGVPVKTDIDRIFFKEDNKVIVQDWKTGSTANIKKKSKNGEDYHNQVMFGMMVIDELQTRAWKPIGGEIITVNPTETLIIPVKYEPEAKDQVMSMIATAYQGIMDQKFIGCGDPECYWCNFNKQK